MVRCFNQSNNKSLVVQIFSHFKSNKSSSNYSDMLRFKSVNKIFNMVSVRYISYGKYSFRFYSFERRSDGFSSGWENKFIVREKPFKFGLDIYCFNLFFFSIYSNCFSIIQNINIKTRRHWSWCLNQKLLSVFYHVTYIIG